MFANDPTAYMSQRAAHKLKTPEDVRRDFLVRGATISQWARDNGFKTNLVFEVLAGRSKARYGMSHRIAVLLGMKRGQL